MHELGITKYLLTEVLDQGNQQQTTKITRVHLTLGELSGYIGESIQFYWDTIAKGTIAESATITHTFQPAIWKCHNCNKNFKTPTKETTCPHCYNKDIQLSKGSECLIDYIECL